MQLFSTIYAYQIWCWWSRNLVRYLVCLHHSCHGDQIKHQEGERSVGGHRARRSHVIMTWASAKLRGWDLAFDPRNSIWGSWILTPRHKASLNLLSRTTILRYWVYISHSFIPYHPIKICSMTECELFTDRGKNGTCIHWGVLNIKHFYRGKSCLQVTTWKVSLANNHIKWRNNFTQSLYCYAYQSSPSFPLTPLPSPPPPPHIVLCSWHRCSGQGFINNKF